jgi:hypothetical protein
MRRGTPYVIRDTDGRPVTPQQANAIIAERWTVPPEIRARRRSKKTGKAPQKVLEGQYTRGGLPAAPLHPVTDSPSRQLLDKRSSIGNQIIPFRRDPAGQPGHGSAVHNGGDARRDG